MVSIFVFFTITIVITTIISTGAFFYPIKHTSTLLQRRLFLKKTSPTTPNVRLFNTREDSAKAIQEALEISKKYGAQSPEARVAWEIAEEIEDSVYSPCSKRCDPIIRQVKSSTIDEEKEQTKGTSKENSPLFIELEEKEN